MRCNDHRDDEAKKEREITYRDAKSVQPYVYPFNAVPDDNLSRVRENFEGRIKIFELWGYRVIKRDVVNKNLFDILSNCKEKFRKFFTRFVRPLELNNIS